MQTDFRLRNSILTATLFVGVIWCVEFCEMLLGWNLHWLGVYPHSATGLIGIVTAPLIHGSLEHITANTLPLLLLGSILLYGYPRSRWWTLGIIWLVSGAGIWLFARPSYHFGASGLTHGMFFFLFVMGILRRDNRSIALLMIAFFMYGSMLLTILPREPDISYEAHFFGALGGVVSALLFRHRDPKPPRKVPSWEREKEEDEDPVIGDLWKPEEERKDFGFSETTGETVPETKDTEETPPTDNLR